MTIFRLTRRSIWFYNGFCWKLRTDRICCSQLQQLCYTLQSLAEPCRAMNFITWYTQNFGRLWADSKNNKLWMKSIMNWIVCGIIHLICMKFLFVFSKFVDVSSDRQPLSPDRRAGNLRDGFPSALAWPRSWLAFFTKCNVRTWINYEIVFE